MCSKHFICITLLSTLQQLCKVGLYCYPILHMVWGGDWQCERAVWSVHLVNSRQRKELSQRFLVSNQLLFKVYAVICTFRKTYLPPLNPTTLAFISTNLILNSISITRVAHEMVAVGTFRWWFSSLLLTCMAPIFSTPPPVSLVWVSQLPHQSEGVQIPGISTFAPSGPSAAGLTPVCLFISQIYTCSWRLTTSQQYKKPLCEVPWQCDADVNLALIWLWH